jgi:DNA processing protein
MAVAHGRPVILTDLVAGRNEWAEDRLGRPGVHVATAPGDVLAIVRELTAERNSIADQLRQLIGA